MDVFDLVAKIRLDDSEYEEGVGKAKGTFSSLVSGVGKGLAVAGTACATAISAAATGVAALTRMSVEGFAQYEQLTGGVQTLFNQTELSLQEYADSVGKTKNEVINEWLDMTSGARFVMNNANEAYRTAGLSANAYMETVTSFSASLIQSLGGDTDKAAQVADMAIVDMADNANKMGTSIEMIQNAYNGFAKGNFTMLDNLKLGYGGTKEEMERLLADAEKISGIEYDISSFADISEAIHVMQDNMGIAGATAAEAATTIEGSIGMMKASWENLITGMANGSDYVGELGLFESFVDSAKTAVTNILPVVSTVLDGIVLLVDQVAPVLIDYIPDVFSQILPSVLSCATGLIVSLVGALPGLVEMLTTSVIPELITGTVTVFNALIESLPTLIESIASALPTLVPQLIDGVVSMILTLCTNLPLAIQPIIDILPDLVNSVVDSLITNLPILVQGLVSLVVALIPMLPEIFMALVEALPAILQGIINGLFPALWEGIQQLCSTLWESLGTLLSGLFSTFGEWLAPIWEAISTWFTDLWNSVVEWCTGVWEGAKSVFSTVAEWIDTNVIQPVLNFFQGLWDGIVAVWDGICNAVTFAINLIGAILNAAWQIITLPFRFIWENCKEYVFAAWEWIKTTVTTAIENVRNTITTIMTAISTFFTNVWNGIKDVFTTVWNAISEFLSPIIEAIKNFIVERFEAVKQQITDIWNAVVNVVTTVWNAIKNAVTTAINAVKNTVTNVFTTVKNTVTNVWNNIKTSVTNAVNSVKNTVTNVFNSVKTTVTSVWNGIKTAIETPINNAKEIVKNAIDAIKGFFNFEFNWPSLKMPHFGISPAGWKIGDLLEGEIPSLSIEWYKKAYDNAMVLSNPTIFGYSNGRLLGGGDGSGNEIVAGESHLMGMIGSVVESRTAVQNERVVSALVAILEAITGGNDEMVRAILADKRISVGEREFARLVKTYA